MVEGDGGSIWSLFGNGVVSVISSFAIISLLSCGCLCSASSHSMLGWSVIVAYPGHTLQWRSQNAEKVTHIKGG